MNKVETNGSKLFDSLQKYKRLDLYLFSEFDNKVDFLKAAIRSGDLDAFVFCYELVKTFLCKEEFVKVLNINEIKAICERYNIIKTTGETESQHNSLLRKLKQSKEETERSAWKHFFEEIVKDDGGDPGSVISTFEKGKIIKPDNINDIFEMFLVLIRSKKSELAMCTLGKWESFIRSYLNRR